MKNKTLPLKRKWNKPKLLVLAAIKTKGAEEGISTDGDYFGS